MKANDLRITTLEAETMFQFHQEGAIKYNELTDKEKATGNSIPVKEHKTLNKFVDSFMTELSRSSHGDIVLMEGSEEIRREKGIYEQKEAFINLEPKKK